MQNLRKIMTRRGISQKNLAEMTGLSQGAVSMILRGERVPRWDTIITIATALGVPTDELRDDIDQEEKPEEQCAPQEQMCLYA